VLRDECKTKYPSNLLGVPQGPLDSSGVLLGLFHLTVAVATYFGNIGAYLTLLFAVNCFLPGVGSTKSLNGRQ
jgi:hypothetical protein